MVYFTITDSLLKLVGSRQLLPPIGADIFI